MLHTANLSRALGVTSQIGVTAALQTCVSREPQSAKNVRWRRAGLSSKDFAHRRYSLFIVKWKSKNIVASQTLIIHVVQFHSDIALSQADASEN